MVYFDKRVETTKTDNYIVLDGRQSMVSYTATYFRGGGQTMINKLNSQPLIVWTEPYGQIETMDDMRTWLKEINPGITERYIDHLSGTDITFLWVLSYGRKRYLTRKYISENPEGVFILDEEARVLVLDIDEAFTYLLNQKK